MLVKCFQTFKIKMIIPKIFFALFKYSTEEKDKQGESNKYFIYAVSKSKII